MANRHPALKNSKSGKKNPKVTPKRTSGKKIDTANPGNVQPTSNDEINDEEVSRTGTDLDNKPVY